MPRANEPIAVNTGPILALDACGQLDLLKSLHSRVLIPEAVGTELRRGRGPGSRLSVPTQQPAWLEVRALRAPLSPLLIEYLDPGEAAAIALALEQGIPIVAIDERRGRMVARAFGLQVTGSIGVLLRAKREGLLPAVKPCIASMRERGVWLGQRIAREALREAGEE